jgi:DNA invertase Pin-like site-specific DNA recombinase
MTTAIIYARFSPRKGEDVESNSDQIYYCIEYCNKNKIEIGSIHQDEYKSGDDADRVGLWNAIAELGEGKILLCYKYDRIARDVYLSELVHREARSAGATVVAVEGGYGDGPEQTMIRQILQVFAEYEKKIIGLRTKAAMLRRQKSGQRMSRYAPMGKMVDPEDPTKLVDDPEAQLAMARIAVLHAEGVSMNKICRILTEEGYRPNAKKWHVQTIKATIERMA